MKNGALFQEMIRILYSLEVENFREIFGNEDGRYLWEKFKDHFNGDVGDFICYLDGSNIEILFSYLKGRAG